MSEPKKRGKVSAGQIIVLVLSLLTGLLGGVWLGGYLGSYLGEDSSPAEFFLLLIGALLLFFAAALIQLILHEGGHLLFGLWSGYRFSSFRIFGLMWLRVDGKIRCKRLSIAGTAGQCLMAPPDIVDGKLPVVWYNLGGSLVNLVTGLIFFGLYLWLPPIPVLSLLLLFLAVAGWLFAAINGIPLRQGTVDNDGYNAVSLTRSPEALRAFWVQMKINERLSGGARLRELPDEWFEMPSDEAMKNSMVAAIGVFACNRLIDEGRLAEADEKMAHLLEIESGMVGLHRSLLICDRIFVELVTQNRREVLDAFLTPQQTAFMKQMKRFPSILRTQYAYALLQEKNVERANVLLAQFEASAQKYPYQSDVQNDRDLVKLAQSLETV